jgi:uncharacterized protein YlxW (UPF0749 family)
VTDRTRYQPVDPEGRDRYPDFLADLFRHPLDPGYVAAARRRAHRPPPTRLGHTGSGAARAAVLAVIGFLLVVAYQSALAAKPQNNEARSGLVADVRERRSQTDQLQRRADDLRREVTRQRDEALGEGADTARLRELDAATGLSEVRGNGVVVRLADAPPPLDPVTGKPAASNPGAVLDRDLQDIANELWHAGAEAVAVNGQRLAATTTIRSAGGAILVDFRPVTGPYEVSAIGPDDLAKRFTTSATARRFRRFVDAYGMQFSVRGQRGLTLAAAGEPELRYARPPASPTPSASAGPSGGRRPSGTPVPSASGGGK